MTPTPAPDDLPCRELVELVTEHLEGALDPEVEQRLREHLAQCEGCAHHVAQVRTTVRLAGALAREPLPETLRARLSALHREHTTPGQGPGATG